MRFFLREIWPFELSYKLLIEAGAAKTPANVHVPCGHAVASK